MMLDPQEYLTPGYDISKLTVANLRSVLVEHEVAFPSNATKPQLIDIFTNEVKTKADEILKRYNVKPSKSDIIDMADKVSTESPKGKVKEATKQTLVQEPSPVSDKDKIIPSKRQSDSTTPLKRNKRKTRKRVQSSTLSDDSSTSPTTSFLSMEKFEINENDNIFKGPIDDTPIAFLNKTKYAAKKSKVPVKDILSKFDKSVPSSKVFKSDKSELKSRSESPSPVKDSNTKEANHIEAANKTFDNVYYADKATDLKPFFLPKDNVVEEQEQNIIDVDLDLNLNQSNNDRVDNTFDHRNGNTNTILLDDIFGSTETSSKLNGPTKNIKDFESIINIASSDSDEVEAIEEKADEHLVSTLDVKSFSSLETDDISFSRESIEVDKKDEVETVGNTVEVAENKDVENEHESVNVIQHGSKHGSVFKFFWRTFLLVNALILILLPLTLREIKMNTGYCGFKKPEKLLDVWGKLPNTVQNSLLPAKSYVERLEAAIVNDLKFECEECPENGSCDSNKLTCDYGYVKTYSMKSIVGLVPLKETCQYDYLREEKMRYLSKYTLSYLHRHNEKQLTLDELHDYLRSTKPSSMSVDEYEGYWKKFVEYELSKEPDLSIDFNTKEITLSHRTPTEYYTRTFGNVQRGKKSKNLFKRTPPTVDLKNYYTKADV